MKKAHHRLTVISQHVQSHSGAIPTPCSESQLNLTITPDVALVDEMVHLRLTGLRIGQTVTLVASLTEGSCTFESRGVYRANPNGIIDNRIDPSIAGTFLGVESMGLFWSLKPAAGQNPHTRMIKKDVTTPLVVTINVYGGDLSDDTEIKQTPVTGAVVHRFYKSASVRRIPLKDEKYRGTIFLPEGSGPFPGLVDMYGGMVTLCETRAALLASRGYATYAMSYLPIDGTELEMDKGGMDPNYIKDAILWFSQREYVDENRIGGVGLCYGGYLLLISAMLSPIIKVLVSINSPCTWPDSLFNLQPNGAFGITEKFLEKPWPELDLVRITDEGMVTNGIHECDDPVAVPAWRNGAKLLMIGCEDDSQFSPKWCRFWVSSVPDQFSQNVKCVVYPGAGHLLDPPYTPHCRKTKPGKARMIRAGFSREEYFGQCLMSGGFTQPHAAAQEDMWKQTLDFLDTHL